MSYENGKEIVLTTDDFERWCDYLNGNEAAMKNTNCANETKPVYHLNEATGKKTELRAYEFVFHPNKLDATADDIINNTKEFAEEVAENPQPNRTATAKYYAKDGNVIVEHCVVANA